MAAFKKNRRDFLLKFGGSACALGLVGLGLVLHSRSSSALPTLALRPPGALDEDKFLGACTRCGLCVRECPFHILKLADLGQAVAVGTPYFIARSGPCEMCDDIPCVPVCPTGALQHSMTDINAARMGLAVLIDQESCIAFHGLRCEVCFNVCPIRGQAITLESRHNERSGTHAIFIPVVHSAACTGCGKCEQACILEEAAIKVFPHTLAKGEIGAHYRLGWREKEKAGESLVTPDLPREYNLPEGMRYEHGGRGLISDDSTPFDANPLETLKQGQDLLGQE
jgi:ferredoxin-type protein NapG